jgi:uncharacterized protein (DUF1015 family)
VSAHSTTGVGLVLAPLRAVRYHERSPSELGLVTSPPYDVITESALESLRASHPHNIVRLILPRPGENVAHTLADWLRGGVLVQDRTHALYVYEYAGGGRTVRGLVGNLALRDFAERIILPHEDVMPGPVAGRAELMKTARANLEPILLVYDGDGAASDAADAATSAEPTLKTMAMDGSVHAVWRIDDPDVLTTIAHDLVDRQALIADGHHRYAAYRRCQRELSGEPWNFGLAMLVDQRRHPLHLGAIHRVVRGLTVAEALASPGGGEWHWFGDDDATARKALAQADPDNTLVMSDGTDWACWHGHVADLDTAALHDHLLPGWGVRDDDLLYVHDLDQALARATQVNGVAVLLRPPSVDAVLAASTQGRMMPRKSTSFGPKPRMGLLLRLLDTD